MRRREIIVFIILASILFTSYSLQFRGKNKETCQTRAAIESTATAFQVTLDNLDTLLDEGTDEIKALYDEEIMMEILENIDTTAYYIDEDGIFHNKFDRNGSTGFATGYIPLDDDIKNLLMATESLEDYYARCLVDYPFVSQVYYNETRSFSRVYPSFNTKGMVEYGRDLTNYVFYNATFESGNNSRLISKPYIDPAGNGWVISMVQPVFIEERLKGVLGVDIQLDTLKDMLVTSGGMLVINSEGDIITLSEDMYQQIGLRPLRKHRYYEDVGTTISLPDAYNINRSKIVGFRDMWTQITEDRVFKGEIDFDGKIRSYCSFEIEDFGIYLLHINVQ